MFSLKMKKNLAILLAFLLIPVVFAQFSLPKIDPKLPSINIPTQPVYETYKPTIPTPPPIKIKICDEGKTICRENSFFVCSKNSWQLKQECKFDEVCDSNKGCFKKQFTQPSLSVVKQFPEIKPVEGVPYIPQVCREGDLKCSGIRTNSVMLCQDNEWVVKQKCSSNEECVSGEGCVKKITDAKFPDYSKNYPKPPTPTSAPIDLGCEKIGEHTCFGSLFLTCKDTQLGRIWTDGKECSKPDFCDKAKGCLFSQLPKVSIPVKKPLVSSCGAGDKKCSDNGKELLACSNGEWVTEQKCGERYVCENNRCVPKTIEIRDVEKKVKSLEEQLNTVGDDAQLAQIDLQNTLQKAQQLIQTMSSISESMYDTTMAIVRKQSGLTSEESQEGETSSKKKLSKEEINEIIEDVEEQQEELKDRRQRALTYFQNVDQKTNQMYNMLASVLKTMNEMSGVGVSSRSSALTSEEDREEAKKAQKEAEELIKEAEQNVEQAREEYKKVLKALQEIQDLKIQATQAISETSSQEEKNVMQELLEALKESQEDMEEDKEYYLEKLEEYNKMSEELADYLGDLVDHSTALSEQANRDIKTDLIDKLISKIKQGDVDAVSQLLLLLSKKSKNEQEEIAKKLVSAMNELEQKQRKLFEQLSSLNKEDKSQAQKLSDLNKELNRISLSRQAITNVLRDTMQMQEEIAETTKSVLDTQGRTTRRAARMNGDAKTEEDYWAEHTRKYSEQGEYLAEAVKELSEEAEKLSTARAVDTSPKNPTFVVRVWGYLSNFFSKINLSLDNKTTELIEEIEAQQVEEPVACNEQGLYYGCNNPPYSTPDSCGAVGIQHYSDEGYTDVSLNCCSQTSWGWNCYLNGEQPVCEETELYYGCNNPPYTTQQSCGREGVRYYAGEGHQDVVLSCCTQADWGWNCYFNEQSTSQQQSTCNEEGLYYGCNNPPYATPESCGTVGVSHYQNEGYANVSFNCCTQAVWGWNCYINGQQPAQESYVTTCICTGNNCQPIES